MSTLQNQITQSLEGLSDDSLRFILDMIQRFMKPHEAGNNNSGEPVMGKKGIRRIGSLEGQDLIDMDYDIDECNNEITEMFGVFEQ